MHPFYTADPRVVLVPAEHLSPEGVTPEFRDWLVNRQDWPAASVDILHRGFALYWSRLTDLAARSPHFRPPRLRNIAVVADPLAIHPLAQLLNTSTWSLYASDLDPENSNAEFVAYLLVHGERLSIFGDVTIVGLASAAYWIDRSADERAAFSAAADRSTRPDADLFRIVASAFEWLGDLRHESLRPIPKGWSYETIPGTGIQVPDEIAELPPAMIALKRAAATLMVDKFDKRWRPTDLGGVKLVCEWLEGDAPPLLIQAHGGRIVWDPEHPERLGTLRGVLKQASGAAVRDIHADLEAVARHTRRFLSSLVHPQLLPTRPKEAEQRGYVFMHDERRLLAYDLQEPGVPRLRSPALPYARAMLGARAVHEWCHLAVDARWVDSALPPANSLDAYHELVELFRATLTEAAPGMQTFARRDFGNDDLNDVARDMTITLFSRMPDYAANLLAQRYVDDAERESYVRHNSRTLRSQYDPSELWRMLIRYLYEYQYMRFSFVERKREYFLRSTGFDRDFLASGILTEERFDALTNAVGRVCESFAIDEQWFRPASAEEGPPPAA